MYNIYFKIFFFRKQPLRNFIVQNQYLVLLLSELYLPGTFNFHRMEELRNCKQAQLIRTDEYVLIGTTIPTDILLFWEPLVRPTLIGTVTIYM